MRVSKSVWPGKTWNASLIEHDQWTVGHIRRKQIPVYASNTLSSPDLMQRRNASAMMAHRPRPD
jgi:hypothetical protein